MQKQSAHQFHIVSIFNLLVLYTLLLATWQLSAAALDSWEFTNPTPTNQSLNSIVDGNGTLVAVGTAGVILTSSEEGVWINQISGTEATLLSIAWNGNKFLAVGYQGTIISSLDGVQWSSVQPPFSDHLYNVIWDGNRFITVGSNGTIALSDDGDVWTKSASGVTTTLRDVAYYQGTLVAVGDQATLLRSSDGSVWEIVPPEMVDYYGLTSLTVGSNGFVAINSSVDVTAKSSDGYIWQIDYGYVDIPSGQFEAKNIEWLVGDYFVVGHLTYDTSTSPEVIRSRAVVLTSPDAGNWAVWSSDELTEDGLNAIAAAGSQAISVGVKGAILAQDGTGSWVRESQNVIDNNLQGIAWNGEAYVAVGTGDLMWQGVPAPGLILTSSNGTDWTEALYSLDAQGLYDVAWLGNELIAVGVENGYTGKILSSTNGNEWQKQLISGSKSLYGISSNGLTDVIVGQESALVRTQENPIWSTSLYPTGFRASAVTWNGTEFLAVGSGIASSVDGNNWLQIASVANRRDISCNDNVCVAVGASYPASVVTSEDSITWEEQVTGLEVCEVYEWGEECSGPDLQTITWTGSDFIASGGGVVISSEGGVLWNMESPPSGAYIKDAIWADGRYIGVGDRGLILSAEENPFVTEPFVHSITKNSALITWKTLERSTGIVAYDTSPDQLTKSARSRKTKTNHTVRLKKLKSQTTYYYQATVTIDGDARIMPIETFTTPR